MFQRQPRSRRQRSGYGLVSSICPLQLRNSLKLADRLPLPDEPQVVQTPHDNPDNLGLKSRPSWFDNIMRKELEGLSRRMEIGGGFSTGSVSPTVVHPPGEEHLNTRVQPSPPISSWPRPAASSSSASPIVPPESTSSDTRVDTVDAIRIAASQRINSEASDPPAQQITVEVPVAQCKPSWADACTDESEEQIDRASIKSNTGS